MNLSDILGQFEGLFALLLGWLLGTLSPAISEKIRRRYRAAELKRAIIADLKELRYTMASVSHVLHDHLGLMPDKWLDWVLPILQNYSGPEANPRTVEAVAAIRKCPPSDRHRVPDEGTRVEAVQRSAVGSPRRGSCHTPYTISSRGAPHQGATRFFQPRSCYASEVF